MAFTSNYLQELIDQAGLIFLQDGEYYVDKGLLIGSNTKIIMSPGAKLFREITEPAFGVRPNSNNVMVTGGTVIGQGPSLAATDYGDLSYIFKAKHVTFQDITFMDTLGSHSVDIVGSDDVSIMNCKFLGHNADPNGLFREAVQIDFASYDALPYYDAGSAYFDLKCCDGVKVIGCTFNKSDKYPAPLNAVGTHSQPNSTNKSKNIIIANNIAKGNGGNGSYGFFAHCINFSNVEIINNIVEGYARFVRIYNTTKEYNADGTYISNGSHSYCENINIDGNIVSLYEFFKSAGVYAVSGNGAPHRNIHVKNNNFISDALESGEHYITDFTNCNNIIVADNSNNKIFTVPLRWVTCTNYIDRNNDYFNM